MFFDWLPKTEEATVGSEDLKMLAQIQLASVKMKTCHYIGRVLRQYAAGACVFGWSGIGPAR